jgi:hypothetical protein
LMTHPGVGALTALAFVLIIGKAERFQCGQTSGVLFGIGALGGLERRQESSSSGGTYCAILASYGRIACAASTNSTPWYLRRILVAKPLPARRERLTKPLRKPTKTRPFHTRVPRVHEV